MRRRSWPFAAVLLLATATTLMLYGEEPRPERAAVAVTFPRRLDKPQAERMRARQTLPAAPPSADGEERPPARPRDPLLAAIASGARSAVVVEANALRNSPIGELVIACLLARGPKNPIAELEERAGVDVLQDLDRVAITEHGVVLSGRFEGARWDGLFENASGRLVTWGDQIVMLAKDETQARAALDRLEGRAPSQPILSEEQTYGEIYGVLSADDLARLLPPEHAGLAARLRDAARRVELHVDASHDVGIVVEVEGADAGQVADLGKSVGGLLAAARLRSLAEDQPELAELLELARVQQRDGAFVVEVGLPLELLARRLASCKEEQ